MYTKDCIEKALEKDQQVNGKIDAYKVSDTNKYNMLQSVSEFYFISEFIAQAQNMWFRNHEYH